MSEFEVDKDSMSRAEQLSSKLIHDLRMASEEGASTEMRRELFSERHYAEQAEGVPVSDVVANIDQMAMEFAMARYLDGKILCLKLDNGELAPVSMNEFFGGSFLSSLDSEDLMDFYKYSDFPPFRHFWRNKLRRAGSEEEQSIVTDFREAQEGIERSLNGFLSYRFAGIKKWKEWIHGTGTSSSGNSGSSGVNPLPTVGAGGGLQVQVSCLTPGLRIHISPAYFINWVYFGSPSSPVTSYVLPGRYVFAGDGPMLPRRKKDNGIFCIPPSYHPSLVGF
jgi:hypothetical protein